MIAFDNQPPIIKAQGLLKSILDDLADKIAEIMIYRPNSEKYCRWQAVKHVVQYLRTVSPDA